MTICRIARWITKATDTHSEYVTLTAFPLPHWSHERSPMLRLFVFISCNVWRYFEVHVSIL